MGGSPHQHGRSLVFVSAGHCHTGCLRRLIRSGRPCCPSRCFCNFSRPHPGGQWLKCTPSFAIPWNPVSVEPRGASSSPQTLFGGLSVDSMARKCFEQTFIRVWVQTQVFAFLFVWNRLAIWNANGLEIKGLPEQLRGPWLFHSLSFSGLANHFVNLGASKLSPRNPCCNGFCLKLSTEYVF